MQINHIVINRSDITKENVNSHKYSYNSTVNNNTNGTSKSIIESAVSVLFDIYKLTIEDIENEVEEI